MYNYLIFIRNWNPEHLCCQVVINKDEEISIDISSMFVKFNKTRSEV